MKTETFDQTDECQVALMLRQTSELSRATSATAERILFRDGRFYDCVLRKWVVVERGDKPTC